MYLPILIGGLVVFVVLFFAFAIWYSTTVLKAMVDKNHRSADFVINTGKVPPDWAHSIGIRVLGPHFAKKVVLGRLKRVMRYFRFTPLVSDDETRMVILKKLDAVREKWTKSDWLEITIPEENASSRENTREEDQQ